jgi:hypothetical protein
MLWNWSSSFCWKRFRKGTFAGMYFCWIVRQILLLCWKVRQILLLCRKVRHILLLCWKVRQTLLLCWKVRQILLPLLKNSTNFTSFAELSKKSFFCWNVRQNVIFS